MSEVWNVLRHKYFGAAATVFLIIMLPVILFASQRPQSTTGIAEGATILTFSPITSESFPMVKKINDEFSLDVLINPGKNVISVVKLDVKYDPYKMKFSADNPITINSLAFAQILEGPFYSRGNFQIVLSIGPNQTKALTTQTKVLTLNFTALSGASITQVYFGKNTEALTVSSSGDGGKNVLSTTVPTYIKIE